MAGNEVHFVVVTPEAQVAEGTAQSVVIPAHDGELGILRNRAPLMCELGIGQMRYTADGQTQRLFIDGGFAQVNRNDVTVLSARAVPESEITPEMIADAEKAAEKEAGSGPDAGEFRRKARQRANVLRRLKS